MGGVDRLGENGAGGGAGCGRGVGAKLARAGLSVRMDGGFGELGGCASDGERDGWDAVGAMQLGDLKLGL